MNRVFELAKELGVPSKRIVETCKARNITGVTNHMSRVSPEVAATIRQWFRDKAGDTNE